MLKLSALEILHRKFSPEINISKNKYGFNFEIAKEKPVDETNDENIKKWKNFIILLPLLVTLLGIIVMYILNRIFG